VAATTKASAAEEAATKGTGMATLLSLLRASTMEDKSFVSAAGAGGEEKVEWLRSQLIGKGVEFDTPFGRRVLTYADQTASGRSLRYIEDYIANEVLPFYGEGGRRHSRSHRLHVLLFPSAMPVVTRVFDVAS
jgi:hypothetical protein